MSLARRSVLALVVLAAMACSETTAPAQERGNEALEKAVDRLVRAEGVVRSEPGVAILVFQPGRRAFKKGYGLATLDDRQPITSSTLFELASLSKPMTAVAVLMLMEKGKLSLGDDVRKHLPELPAYDPKMPVRIRHLLRHISGLPDYLAFETPALGEKGYVNANDYLPLFEKGKAEFPMHFPTGERYEYGNTNYMLLALIVARVSGQPFGEFLRDNLFGPAGMTASFVMENPRTMPKPSPNLVRAIGYSPKEGGGFEATWGAPPARKETLLTVGDGAIWSNLDDMAKFDVALRQNRLLKPETLKQALTPSKTANGETNNYGFGWSIYPDNAGGMNGFGHDGSWLGFETSFYRYQVANRTTVILSNRGGFNVDGFWYKLNNAVEAAW
jgi:CubicO group peptidase (beta-lactamase class C family)